MGKAGCLSLGLAANVQNFSRLWGIEVALGCLVPGPGWLRQMYYGLKYDILIKKENEGLNWMLKGSALRISMLLPYRMLLVFWLVNSNLLDFSIRPASSPWFRESAWLCLPCIVTWKLSQWSKLTWRLILGHIFQGWLSFLTWRPMT